MWFYPTNLILTRPLKQWPSLDSLVNVLRLVLDEQLICVIQPDVTLAIGYS